MTSPKATRRALVSSVLALLVCFTMLIGTTFAWFTDSVTSGGNIIQSGTLDIGFYYANGDEDPASAVWNDASSGALFQNTNWEPGYTEARHLKISNLGTLALKYKLLIVPNGEVEALADVIDVYYVEGATALTRDVLETATPIGTLRDLINETDGAAHGALLPVGATATVPYERVGEVTATIALRMRTDVGNEYQDMMIGGDFSLQLLATQYTFEGDSFDNQYDANTESPAPIVVESKDELMATLAEATPGMVIDATGVVLDIPASSTVTLPAGVTIRGVEVKYDARGIGYALIRGGDEPVVFEECTFTGSDPARGAGIFTTGVEADGATTIEFNDCTFEGPCVVSLVNKTSATAYYNNCTFTKNPKNHGYITVMGGTHEFKNCTFDYTDVLSSTMSGTMQGAHLNINGSAYGDYSTVANLYNCQFVNANYFRYGDATVNRY